MNLIRQLHPAKQPVTYVFLIVVLYQLFVKGDSLPNNWIQYIIETLGAGITWSVVTPTSKLKKDDNAPTDV